MRGRTLLISTITTLGAGLALAQTPPSFTRVGSDFPVGTSPLAIATGDFNNDTKTDVVTANADSGDVTVLNGNGDGTFAEPGATFPVGPQGTTSPSAIAVGDLNGDALPDLVVTDDTNDTANVLLNQGGGVFGSPISVNTGSSPEGVAVADFNGDGHLDVATADNLDDTVSILFGTGDGHLVPTGTCLGMATQTCSKNSDCGASGVCNLPIPVGSAPAALVAVDVDGDGKTDLVVVNSMGGNLTNPGSLTILKGAGDGTFVAQPELTSATFDSPVAIAAGTLITGGKIDLVVANEEADNVSVLLGNGDLTFPTVAAYPVGSLPEGVVIADFNNDGQMDIATANSFDDNVSVLIGKGDGTFTPAAAPFAVGSSPNALAVASLNGDTLPDIVTANTDDDTASVLLNSTGSGTPTPEITPTPTSAPPTATATPGAAVCAGDCNGNGHVAVNEIIVLVNIILGTAQPSACMNGIPSGSAVNISLVLKAVNNDLNGCPM